MISNLIQTAETILFRTARLIGPMLPDVTVEEAHRDSLIITDHPVEQGSVISDHAFKRPAELVIRAGWSNSSPQAGGILGLLNPLGGGWSGYAQEIYQELLSLQAAREPMDVITGKRLYSNMLIQDLTTVTDEKTENVLLITIRLREVILVQTMSTTLPPKSDQAQPQNTASVESAGSKQLTPVTNQSVLSSIGGLF